ncbi:MAG TPA: transketolase C-terminal domain-containing protein [Thermoanaerobaculia bacterium]|nr:transketolase C-terminal domain-containing protein [Thermoanaerobaculia bacterium]
MSASVAGAPAPAAAPAAPVPTYEEALQAIALARPDVIVMTAENRAAIRGLPAVLGERFVDVGICEQTMIGAAAGLALRGRTPVVHALASFLVMRAFEFIRTDVGIANLPVKLIGYVPGFLSDANGPTHQAIEDVALMRGIPNMQVFCPADAAELAAALPLLIDSRAPCYVRFNAMPPAVAHPTPFAIGKAEVLSRAPNAPHAPEIGSDAGAGGPGGRGVALLTYGFLLREVDRARALLEARGIPVELINLRSLKPLDEAAVLEAAARTRRLVAVEDHFQTGGLYSILAELLAHHAVACRLHSISLGERWFKPALLPDVLEHEGFTGPRIAERVLALL